MADKPGLLKRLFGERRPLRSRRTLPDRPKPSATPAPHRKASWFERLTGRLKRSSDADRYGYRVRLHQEETRCQAMLDELEDILIQRRFRGGYGTVRDQKPCAATGSTETSRPTKCAPFLRPKSKRPCLPSRCRLISMSRQSRSSS